MRYAITSNGSLATVRTYLPRNYGADTIGDDVYVAGKDHAGWTLDGYVIPRLASGLITAREVCADYVADGSCIHSDHTR